MQTVESQGVDYYYSLLLLYIPWRKEPEDLLKAHSSVMEAFIVREGEIVVLNAHNHASESAHSGEESEKEELISGHFVQNCSQNEEKSSAAVKGSSALVHNDKCMSQSYVKIGKDKGTHGKEHTSAHFMLK